MRAGSGDNKVVTLRGKLFYVPAWGVNKDKTNFYVDLFELECAPMIAANDKKKGGKDEATI